MHLLSTDPTFIDIHDGIIIPFDEMWADPQKWPYPPWLEPYLEAALYLALAFFILDLVLVTVMIRFGNHSSIWDNVNCLSYACIITTMASLSCIFVYCTLKALYTKNKITYSDYRSVYVALSFTLGSVLAVFSCLLAVPLAWKAVMDYRRDRSQDRSERRARRARREMRRAERSENAESLPLLEVVEEGEDDDHHEGSDRSSPSLSTNAIMYGALSVTNVG